LKKKLLRWKRTQVSLLANITKRFYLSQSYNQPKIPKGVNPFAV